MPAASQGDSAGTVGPAPLPNADLVASLPGPILRLLIIFAGPIAALRVVLEVVLWKPERRVQSWMLLLLWWALCLGGGYVFAWLAPVIVFAPLLPLQRLRLGPKPPPTHTTPTKPATSETLLYTLGDLYKVLALLPPSPLPPVSATYARFQQLGARRLFRGLVVLWGIWVVLDKILGTRVLVAFVGTGLILIPSPPLAQVIHLLSQSLVVRRSVALLFLLIFGSPSRDYTLGSPMGWIKSKWAFSRRPSAVLATNPVKNDDEPAPADRAGHPIYFRFELHENQRWWMGLDWTSALLPQERPSWCDSHLLPVAPPQAFTLPPPSSIDLPAPTKADPKAKVRRTATWRWLDDDWSVVKKTKKAGGAGASGSSGTTNDDDPPLSPNSTSTPRAVSGKASRPSSGIFGQSPTSDEGHARSPSMAEAAFAKGLGRLKGVPIPGTATPSAPSPASKTAVDMRRQRTGSEASDASHDEVSAVGHPEVGVPPPDSIPPADDETDPDGWVYGDNKWENMNAKGGLGKFTRRRRWTRRAVCTETVHRIIDRKSSEDVGSGAATPMARSSSNAAPSSPAPKGTAAPSIAASDEHPRRRSSDARKPTVAPQPAPSSIVPPANSADVSRDEHLRQRLKKAMGNMGA